MLARYCVVEVNGRGRLRGCMMVDEAHITNIAVHPEYRGRGIGTKPIGFDSGGIGTNIYGMTLRLDVRT